MSQYDSSIKVSIVDLIPTRTAKELGAIDVHSDLVAGLS